MRNPLRLAQRSYDADRADRSAAPSHHLTSVAEDDAESRDRGEWQDRIGRPLTAPQLSSARRLQDIMSDMEAELKEQVDKLIAERH